MKALFASVKTKSRRAFMGLLKMSAPFLFPSWPGASEESQILSPFRLVFLDGMQGDLHRRFQHDHVGILRTKKLCDTRPCNAPRPPCGHRLPCKALQGAHAAGRWLPGIAKGALALKEARGVKSGSAGLPGPSAAPQET